MRFLVFMIPGDTKSYEGGAMPDDKLVAKMMKYNEDLAKAGVLLALDGLHPTSKGARLSFSGGKATVKDGPFTEARELIGGYWLWQCKSRDEALEWAKRCPAMDGDTLEVRQLFDAADFGPEIAKQEAAFEKKMAENKATTSK